MLLGTKYRRGSGVSHITITLNNVLISCRHRRINLCSCLNEIITLVNVEGKINTYYARYPDKTRCAQATSRQGGKGLPMVQNQKKKEFILCTFLFSLRSSLTGRIKHLRLSTYLVLYTLPVSFYLRWPSCKILIVTMY